VSNSHKNSSQNAESFATGIIVKHESFRNTQIMEA
jgi:hypothetical protein